MNLSGVGWEPDVVASALYRAPQTISYSWDYNNVTVASGPTLTANDVGVYGCHVTATNAAGSTTVRGPQFFVNKPRLNETAPALTVHVAKVRRDRRHGLATVFVKVSGAGMVTLIGKSVVNHSIVTRAAETRKLPVRLKPSARKHLIATGRAKVGLVLTFYSGAVSPAVARQTITLIRRPKA